MIGLAMVYMRIRKVGIFSLKTKFTRPATKLSKSNHKLTDSQDVLHLSADDDVVLLVVDLGLVVDQEQPRLVLHRLYSLHNL